MASLWKPLFFSLEVESRDSALPNVCRAKSGDFEAVTPLGLETGDGIWWTYDDNMQKLMETNSADSLFFS